MVGDSFSIKENGQNICGRQSADDIGKQSVAGRYHGKKSGDTTEDYDYSRRIKELVETKKITYNKHGRRQKEMMLLSLL
jgi:hypothetical protein